MTANKKKRRESADDLIWSNKYTPGFHPDGEGTWSRNAAAGHPVRDDIGNAVSPYWLRRHGRTTADMILRHQLELGQLRDKLRDATGARRDKILEDVAIKTRFVARLQAELDHDET
jgi:hypothetical protein